MLNIHKKCILYVAGHRAHSMYVGVHLPGEKRHRKHKHHSRSNSTDSSDEDRPSKLSVSQHTSWLGLMFSGICISHLCKQNHVAIPSGLRDIEESVKTHFNLRDDKNIVCPFNVSRSGVWVSPVCFYIQGDSKLHVNTSVTNARGKNKKKKTFI